MRKDKTYIFYEPQRIVSAMPASIIGLNVFGGGGGGGLRKKAENCFKALYRSLKTSSLSQSVGRGKTLRQLLVVLFGHLLF